MIRRLSVSNCLIHQQGTWEFEEGLTAIVGPNGSGKSLLLELVRYALFGSDALRGVLADIAGSEVILELLIKGQPYVIRRTTKTATLTGPDLEVVGTKPVGDKVISLLGFGLAVFDTACCANQGMIEALGQMKPGDRKRMVDEVVGLGLIDKLAAWCGEEACALDREARARREGLTPPLEPRVPPGYRPMDVIQAEHDAAVPLAKELERVRGWLSQRMEQPVAPVCAVQDTVDVLQAHQARRQAAANALSVAERTLAGMREPTHTQEQIDQARALHQAHKAQVAARKLAADYPTPTLTQAEIDAGLAGHALFKRWGERKALLARGHEQCPNCKHTWPRAADALAPYADVPDTVTQPQHTVSYIQGQQGVLDRWLPQRETLEQGKATLARPLAPLTHTEQDIWSWEQQIRDNGRRLALVAEVSRLKAELAQIADRSADLRTRQAYDAALVSYQASKARYDTWLIELALREARLAELAGADTLAETLAQALAESRAYETAQIIFEGLRDVYAASMAWCTEREAEAGEYRKARTALGTLKVRVKQYLVPSLSRVSSDLLSAMTAGGRSSVKVTEDFDVTVDGQSLDTLEGSAKALANLALRIALGQVLTSKVFPCFLGDEIDAALDADRGPATAATLRGLTKTLKQVILVSHRQIDADHVIDLGIPQAQMTKAVAA